MKKIISTVAAFGLALGMASAASALDLTVTGKYVLEGYYMNQADGAVGFTPAVDSDDAGSMSAWVHTFLFKPTLKVNDKIKMVSDIRFLKDTEMGDKTNQGGTSMGIGDREVDIHKIYMEWMSPLGKTRLGRTPGGAWAGDFLSSSSNADRLMWWPSFVKAPFQLLVFTQKSVENDWYTSNNDSDSDLYKADLTYKADNMLMKAAYNYINDKTHSDDAGTAAVWSIDQATGLNALTAAVPGDSYDHQVHKIELYADMTFDNIYVEFEGAYVTGDARDYDSNTDDIDVEAYGAMLDVGMKMGDLDVGAMYFYASGDDDTADDDLESLMSVTGGTGDDFNPYYILTGDHSGMLNSDEYAQNATMSSAGVHCIGLHSDYKVSDQLSLHGALAYAEADEEPNNIDSEYGWEVDLGAKYKLLDNLTYEVRAAYMDTGDFFDDNATAGESDDLYMLSHHLTMTF